MTGRMKTLTSIALVASAIGLARPAASAAEIDGTDGNDHIVGTSRRDDIQAFAGDDKIFGLGGGDRIRAGRGDDHLVGGPSIDSLEGRQGSDVLLGGRNNDSLLGGPGSDISRGGRGGDFIHDWGRNTRMFGGPRRDLLFAHSGDPGRELLNCGRGFDKLAYTFKVDPDDTIVGCEQILENQH